MGVDDDKRVEEDDKGRKKKMIKQVRRRRGPRVCWLDGIVGGDAVLFWCWRPELTARVRPQLEYPPIPVWETGVTNMRTLQRVQNKATRFITGAKLADRKRSSELHTRTKLEAVNARLTKLAKKQLYVIKDRYVDGYPVVNTGTDYIMEEEPRQEKQQSLAAHIQEVIYRDPENCPWFQPEEPGAFTIPAPMFT